MESSQQSKGVLDLWSGVGIVAANMIGAGVFLSAGFMAQDMSAGWILVAWIVGAFLASTGARAYAEVSRLVPRSGGEYRYLSELVHPALGYLAGWASLLVGFSAPIAINALGAAAFMETIVDLPAPRIFGAAIIVGLTVFHAIGLRSSKWTQNGLVVAKVILLLGFVVLGVVAGSHSWPEWSPPNSDGSFDLGVFATSLFFIAFAFSGWNAAIYAAEEFRDPARDVPRAMLIGCGLVAAVYFVINWVFVANLTPEQGAVVFTYEETHITLGHVVIKQLVGPIGGALMSAFATLAFISAMSAMIMVGPRVYAAMARDGFLPSVLAGSTDKPPVGSIVLQGAIAIALMFIHSLRDVLINVSGVLVLFSALVALSLFTVRWRRPDLPKPRLQSLIAAAIYAGSSSWMLYFGFKSKTGLLGWVAAVIAAALVGYFATNMARNRSSS
jgi:APA family basic amino acid/polyamine antiporter